MSYEKFLRSQMKVIGGARWDEMIRQISSDFAALFERAGIEEQTADKLLSRGLQVIEDLVSPVALQAQTRVDQIDALITNGTETINYFSLTATQKLAAIEGYLETIEAGGITANLVVETAERSFIAAALRTKLLAMFGGDNPVAPTAPLGDDSERLANMAALHEAIEALTGDVDNDLAALAEAVAKATLAEIKSGTGDRYLTNGKAWGAAAWVSLGNLSGAVTLDASTGSRFYGTMTGNVTIDVSNLKNGQPIEIVLMQDATGNRTVSWAAKFKWPSATVPGVGTTANGYAVIVTGIGTWGTDILAAGWKVTA
jgi:hypothetical protein